MVNIRRYEQSLAAKDQPISGDDKTKFNKPDRRKRHTPNSLSLDCSEEGPSETSDSTWEIVGIHPRGCWSVEKLILIGSSGGSSSRRTDQFVFDSVHLLECLKEKKNNDEWFDRAHRSACCSCTLARHVGEDESTPDSSPRKDSKMSRKIFSVRFFLLFFFCSLSSIFSPSL